MKKMLVIGCCAALAACGSNSEETAVTPTSTEVAAPSQTANTTVQTSQPRMANSGAVGTYEVKQSDGTVIRQQLNPIAGTAMEFLEALDEGKVFSEQPLATALAEFLRDETGESIAPADFDNVRLPEYLKLKLAELNEKGRIKEIHYDD